MKRQPETVILYVAAAFSVLTVYIYFRDTLGILIVAAFAKINH
jgi:predicted outer membrane lipoprotein